MPSIAISSIATFARECLLFAARFPRPGYVLLRYADSPNCLIVSDGRRSVPRSDAFRGAMPSSEGILETKDEVMKARSHAADYYRRILSAQPHGLKRLDPVAAIMYCHRGQEIPNSPGPAGHWYCVIVGAVRRCTIRSDGRRQIVDLMLPQDFFFVADSKRDGTIEAVVEETVLASYPGARVEQLAERDQLFARELR